MATSQHGGHFHEKAAKALLSSLVDTVYRHFYQPPTADTDAAATATTGKPKPSAPYNKDWPPLLRSLYKSTQQWPAQAVLMLVMEALEVAIASNRVAWWKCVALPPSCLPAASQPHAMHGHGGGVAPPPPFIGSRSFASS